MKRFITFYSEELKRDVRIPIDISIEEESRIDTLHIRIPEQNFMVAKEITFPTARWEEAHEFRL